MSTWSIRIDLILNEQDAKKKIEEYIAGHPGLILTSQLPTQFHGGIREIEVRSAGEVDVDIGPIRDQQDAEKNAAFFMKFHPYLKWTGHWKTVVPSRSSVIQLLVEEPHERQRLSGTIGWLYPVPITVRLRNQTKTNIKHIRITGVHGYDWGKRQPTRFDGRSIEGENELEEQLDANYWCCSAPFEVWFQLASRGWVTCRLDGRVAIDCCRWNGWETQWITDDPTLPRNSKELAVYYRTYWFEKAVDIVVCEAAEMQDTDELLEVSHGPLLMNPDGWEPTFWRLLIELLTLVGSPFILPNALDEFNRQLAANSRYQQWDRIFRIPGIPSPIYGQVVQAVPDMLADLWLIAHQPSFIELLFYAGCTLLGRYAELQPGSRSYQGHLNVVNIWHTTVNNLWNRLVTILAADAAIVVITAAVLCGIAAAAAAAIEAASSMEVAVAELSNEARVIMGQLTELSVEIVRRLLQLLMSILDLSKLPPKFK